MLRNDRELRSLRCEPCLVFLFLGKGELADKARGALDDVGQDLLGFKRILLCELLSTASLADFLSLKLVLLASSGDGSSQVLPPR